MSDKTEELHEKIEGLYKRIIELEREVASLRVAQARREPVYVPLPGPAIPYPVYPYQPTITWDGTGVPSIEITAEGNFGSGTITVY